MKFLIFFIFSLSAYANFVPKEKISICNNLKVYTKIEKCEKKEKKDCIKIPSDYNCAYHEIVPETQMKEDVESCLDEADCQSKLEAKLCEKGEAIKNLDTMEVYCTWLRPEQVMVNQTLKDAYEAQKAQEDSKKAILAQIKSARDCGEKVINEMIYRNNVLKSLSKGQKKQVLQAYSEIKGLLEVGNLSQAKDDITATTADGTIVTEDDKTALIAKIDECLGL